MIEFHTVILKLYAMYENIDMFHEQMINDSSCDLSRMKSSCRSKFDFVRKNILMCDLYIYIEFFDFDFIFELF